MKFLLPCACGALVAIGTRRFALLQGGCSVTAALMPRSVMKRTDATDALWQPGALISWSYSSRGVGTEFDGERNIVVHQSEHLPFRRTSLCVSWQVYTVSALTTS